MELSACDSKPIIEHQAQVNKTPVSTRLSEAKTAADLLALAKQSSPPDADSAGVTNAAGDLFFGADLGQVRVRKANGEWSGIDEYLAE